MKKQILELLEKESGIYRLNEFCSLVRFTKSALNENVDVLELNFDAINGIHVEYSEPITSRTYEGITDECAVHISKFLDKFKFVTIKNLKTGYGGGDKVVDY